MSKPMNAWTLGLKKNQRGMNIPFFFAQSKEYFKSFFLIQKPISHHFIHWFTCHHMYNYMWFYIQIREAAASQPWNKTSRSLKKRAQALQTKIKCGTGRSHVSMKDGMDRSHTHIGRCLKQVTNTSLGRSHGKVSTGNNQQMCGGINGRNHMMRSTQQITDGRSLKRCGVINGRNHMMNLSKIAPKQPHVGHGRKSQQPAPPLRQPLQTYWKQSSRTNTGPMSCS